MNKKKDLPHNSYYGVLVRTKRLLLYFSLVTVIAGLGGLFATVIVKQPDRPVFDFDWTSTAESTSKPFVLAASEPDSLHIDLSCPSRTYLRKFGLPVRLFATSSDPAYYYGIQVLADDSVITAKVADGELGAISAPYDKNSNCRIQVDYLSTTRELSLTTPGYTVNTKVLQIWDTDLEDQTFPTPRVTGFHLNDPFHKLDVFVAGTTHTSETSPTGAQRTAMLCLVLLALLSIVLLSYFSPRPEKKERRKFRFAKADVFVGIAAIASAVLTPPAYDDGWVIATARAIKQLGFATNYYDHKANVPQAQGTWLTWLNQFILRDGIQYVYMRLAPLTFAFLAWLIIRHVFINRMTSDSNRSAVTAMSAMFYVLWIAAFLTTIRPEPYLTFLWVIAATAVFNFRQSLRLQWLITYVFVSALAFTAHQTGYVLVVLVILMINPFVRLVRQATAKTLQVLIVAIGCMAAGLPVLALLIFDTRPADLREGMLSFAESDTHNLGPLDEPNRWADALLNGPSLKKFVVFVLIMTIVGSVIRPAKNRHFEYEFRLIALTSIIGMFFTSSKWFWHFAVLAPAAALLMAVTFASLTEFPLRLSKASTGVAMLAVYTGAWSLKYSHRWLPFDLTSLDWKDQGSIFGVDLGTTVGLAALCFGLYGAVRVFAIMRPRFNPNSVMLFSATALAVVLSLGGTWGFIAKDAVQTDGWTFAKGNLHEAIFNSECGMGDSIEVVTDTKYLPAEDLESITRNSKFRNYVNLPTYRRSGPAQNVPVYGYDKSMKLDRTEVIDLGWQEIAGGEPIGFWTLGGERDKIAARVILRTPDTTLVRKFTLTNDPWWNIHQLDVPADVTAAKVVIDLKESKGYKMVSFTSLVGFKYQTLTDFVHDKKVMVAPAMYTYATCLDLPGFNGGVLEDYKYHFGAPLLISDPFAFESPVSEIGCFDRFVNDDPVCLLQRVDLN